MSKNRGLARWLLIPHRHEVAVPIDASPETSAHGSAIVHADPCHHDSHHHAEIAEHFRRMRAEHTQRS
jgi:hypothetical protein